ncbi:ArsC family reductase [Pokkaliibacter plantistimulans]|uniref:ArsC family reductase n=1 Tax=Proteobacteria bacterium 228 TaxID=2083153 RepID=A0A2S5KJB8_9PROT|nr:ArsC family reductase [Pokkaliibacter plantistimulans]PPC74901.1 ArsC family reductase [Pokkaliibacter plantistimulans]
MITLYGIKNCDTIKKARKWLEAQQLDYRFHDYRVDGLTQEQLTSWCDELGWQALLNTRGTTWRGLSDEQKSDMDSQRAIALMLEQPALIKRPLLDTGSSRHLGFKEADYAQWLG